MTPNNPAVGPTAHEVLRRALGLWGLGHLALGRRRVGITWLIAEVLAAAVLAYLVTGLVATTWYVVPFVAGIAFLIAWATQAVLAYRVAREAEVAVRVAGTAPISPSAPGSVLAWLSVPLLLWGTGFWLLAAASSSPAAVLDRFETAWPAVSGGSWDPAIANTPTVVIAARDALGNLQRLCAENALSADCAATPRNLLRDVRFSITSDSGVTATAEAQVVAFERRPAHFLGIFATTELVPVPRETVLTLALRAMPAPLPGGVTIGARGWEIVNATTP